MGLAKTFRLHLLHYCYVGSGILSFSWSLSGLRFSEPFGGHFKKSYLSPFSPSLRFTSSLIQIDKPSFVLSRIRNSQHGILPYYTRVQEIQFSVRCKAKVIKEIELPVSFTAKTELIFEMQSECHS